MSPRNKKRRKKNVPSQRGLSPSKAKVSARIDKALSRALQYHQSGNLAEADRIYHRILEVRPDHADALHFLGIMAQQTGNSDKAIELVTKSIAIAPEHPIYHHNLGMVLCEQGRLKDGAECFKKAIQLLPDYVEAYRKYGDLCLDNGPVDDAIRCFRKVVELEPDDAEAYNKLGIALQEQGRLDEAISCCQKAIQIKPDYVDAYANLGHGFQEQGKLEDAKLYYTKALDLKPDPGIEVRKSLLLPPICQSERSIEHDRGDLVAQLQLLEEKGLALEDPYEQVAMTQFVLAYHGLNDKKIQERLAAFYTSACPDLSWTSDRCRNWKGTTGKIEIGIISYYLYNHTIGNLNLGIIRNLSRDKFHVKLFRFPGKEDDLSKEIDGAADEVVLLPPGLKASRQSIADHALDILYYLDVGMDPLTYFLAFSRLAPVQCVTWGHPETTGIPNMDYFISSDTAEPHGAQDHYSEKLVRLKRLGIYYYRPKLAQLPGPEKFDLPDDCHLYVCPQSLFKFHPDFDPILGAILRRDPFGLLVLIEGSHDHWTELLRQRFTSTFPDEIDRVRFISRLGKSEFLSLLGIADVVLDTTRFGGGKTSLECFACGVPVVTLPGAFLRGRLTLAMYKQMGIMDCVADDAQSYVDTALRLAHDKSWSEKIKGKIKERASVLFEDMEAVRELERFFLWAVEKARKGTSELY